MKAIRVVVGDHHRLRGEAFAVSLGAARDLDVVGVGTTAADVVGLVTSLHPDVVLLSDTLGMGNSTSEGHFSEWPPGAVVLLVRADATPPASSTVPGLMAIVTNCATVEEIVGAIRRAAEGETWIDPRIGAHSPEQTASTVTTLAAGRLVERAMRGLTAGEREVLERLRSGQSTAAELGISYATAPAHIQDVLTKLGVHARLEAAAPAARVGAGAEGRGRSSPAAELLVAISVVRRHIRELLAELPAH